MTRGEGYDESVPTDGSVAAPPDRREWMAWQMAGDNDLSATELVEGWRTVRRR